MTYLVRFLLVIIAAALPILPDIIVVRRPPPAGGGSSIAILTGSDGHAICHGVNGCTTSAIDTTVDGGGDFAVCVVSDYTGGPGVTVSDSPTNSWQTDVTACTNTAGQMRTKIYYAYNITNNASHTFTSAGTGVYTTIACAVFKGVKTASSPLLDQSKADDLASSTIAPMQAGSITVGTGDLAIAGEGTVFGNATTVYTIDLSFSITDQYHVGADTEGAGLAYLIPGSTGGLNPGWLPDISSGGCAIIAEFSKP